MRLLILPAVFFLFCQQLSAQPAIQTFTIAVPFIRDAPPFMWKAPNSKKMIGSTIDSYELIAQQQDYQLQWYFYSPDKNNAQLLKDYQAKKIDIFLDAIPQVIPYQSLRQVDAYVSSISLHAFVPMDSTLSNLTIASLTQYTGVVPLMIKLDEPYMTNKHAIFEQLSPLLTVRDMTETLTMIQQEKADYSIAERASLSILLRENGLHDQYQIMEPALGNINNIMHYRLGSEFENYLEGFNKLCTLFNTNGRFNHIKEKNMRLYLNEIRHKKKL